jgi:hypothetical protein
MRKVCSVSQLSRVVYVYRSVARDNTTLEMRMKAIARAVGDAATFGPLISKRLRDGRPCSHPAQLAHGPSGIPHLDHVRHPVVVVHG